MNHRKIIMILIALVLVTTALVSALPDPSLVITAPKEGEILYIDVIPQYITVQGIADVPEGIENITITDGQKSFDFKTGIKTYSDFSYQFPYTKGNDQITIIVYEVNGNSISETRNVSVYAGIPPPTPGFIWIGCLMALTAVIILNKRR